MARGSSRRPKDARVPHPASAAGQAMAGGTGAPRALLLSSSSSSSCLEPCKAPAGLLPGPSGIGPTVTCRPRWPPGQPAHPPGPRRDPQRSSVPESRAGQPQGLCKPRPPPAQSPVLIQARVQPSWPEDLGQGNSQLETRRAAGSPHVPAERQQARQRGHPRTQRTPL